MRLKLGSFTKQAGAYLKTAAGNSYGTAAGMGALGGAATSLFDPDSSTLGGAARGAIGGAAGLAAWRGLGRLAAPKPRGVAGALGFGGISGEGFSMGKI